MNTRDFKTQNAFIISTAVAITAFIFHYLSTQLIGNPFNPVLSIGIAVTVGLFYFLIHYFLNRYAKKRHRNVAVSDFL